MLAALAFGRIAMFGIHGYWLFVLTGVLLNLTPGQDTFFILGQSIGGGRPAGIAAALGIAVGSIGHTLLAALGLSAVLATSPNAFLVVRLVGAAYLVAIGVRALLAPGTLAPPAGSATTAVPWTGFRRGVLTNLLNPKVALFFLALMPQFIAPNSPTKVLAFLALGGTFITTGLIWCLVLACAAAEIRKVLLRRPRVGSALPRIAGGLFIALGVRLAVAKSA
jgi:threonine/homoserine/homoserine lactone efflux protein